MGHIYRSCLIADQLRNKYRLVFVSLDHSDFSPGHNEINRRGYSLLLIKDKEEMNSLLDDLKPKFAVVDLYEYSRSELYPFFSRNIETLSFDHFDDSKEFSTFCINPVLLQGKGKYDGLNYTVIPSPLKPTKGQSIKKIFLSFGGFDFGGISKRVLSVLGNIPGEFQINLIVGSSFVKEEVSDLLLKDSRVQLFSNPDHFNEILANSDLAIVAGGLTFFQCLSEGLPSIVICQYQHQKETALEMSQDAFILLGTFDDVSDSEIESSIKKLLLNHTLREQLGKAASLLVDGNGLNRVIQLIESAVAK
ncbi:glycosyltransferase [Leptospira idonii]|nr:glycosyltransferase [Leptospira idonii]